MSAIERVKIIPRRLIADERGWFFKAITGKEEGVPDHTGEVYLTLGKPGQSKGGHFHPRAVEWFTVISGRAILKLEDVMTHEKREIPLSLEEAKSVFIPNNVAHEVYNVGNEDFILLAYTDRLYDPADTIPYKVK